MRTIHATGTTLRNAVAAAKRLLGDPTLKVKVVNDDGGGSCYRVTLENDDVVEAEIVHGPAGAVTSTASFASCHHPVHYYPPHPIDGTPCFCGFSRVPEGEGYKPKQDDATDPGATFDAVLLLRLRADTQRDEPTEGDCILLNAARHLLGQPVSARAVKE